MDAILLIIGIVADNVPLSTKKPLGNMQTKNNTKPKIKNKKIR
jgi:hypothetical protein